MKVKNPTLAKLESPFQSIARTMSEKWDINIVACGTGPSTDGENINFPWNMDKITTIPFQVLNGWLDHEVGHIREERRHKDEGRKTPLQLAQSVIKDTTLTWMMNVFEDIRLEIQYGSEYFGVAENLSAIYLHSIEAFKKAHEAGAKGTFWHSVGCGIILASKGLDYSCFGEEYKPYIELCQEEIDASRHVKWGDQTMALAKSVVKKLREHAKDIIEKEKKEREEAEKKRAEEKAKEEAENEGKEEGEPKDKKEGESKPGGEGTPGPEGAKGEGEGGGPTAPHPDALEVPEEKPAVSEKELEVAKKALEEATKTHLADETKEEMREAAEKDLKDSKRYIPNPDCAKLDKWFTAPPGSAAEYNRLRSLVSVQTRALRTKLARRLRALTDDRDSYDQEIGRLDTCSLSQLRIGEKRLFGITTPGVKIHTAVSMLIDQSGSMGCSAYPDTRAYYARLSAIAIAETMDFLNVPFEAVGFDNDSCSHSPPYRPGYANRTPFRYTIFKSFQETYKRVSTRMVNITGGMDNADGEAVYSVALRLAKRPETRKILFVLSDGAPACSGLDLNGHRYLSEVVKRVSASGIEVIAIGLQTDAVKRFYNESTGAKHIVVNDMEQLPVSLFKIMSDRIISSALSGGHHAH